MAKNTAQTGKKAATDASRTVSGKKATKTTKSAAASALSQAPASKGQTGKKAATAAAKTLNDKKATKAEKAAAASTLAQTPKKGGGKKK